jgi:putative glycosyltransferase
LIDCDLEVAPETLLDFYQKRTESNADVVFGVQDNRHDAFANKLFANAFYIVFNWLSDTKIPTNVTTARLMTRRYVSALVAHQEREIMIAGLWAITGFKQESMPVTKAAKGSSTYNLTRKIAILITSVTAFSNRPLILVFYLGSIISLLSGLSALYIIVRIIFFGTFLAGWPSVIVSIWFLGGLIIQCIGIIGIYLSKVFTETKQRPYTIIREIYDPSKSNDL